MQVLDSRRGGGRLRVSEMQGVRMQVLDSRRGGGRLRVLEMQGVRMIEVRQKAVA